MTAAWSTRLLTSLSGFEPRRHLQRVRQNGGGTEIRGGFTEFPKAARWSHALSARLTGRRSFFENANTLDIDRARGDRPSVYGFGPAYVHRTFLLSQNESTAALKRGVGHVPNIRSRIPSKPGPQITGHSFAGPQISCIVKSGTDKRYFPEVFAIWP